MPTKPTAEEAIAAVKTLINFIGDDTNRHDLLDTPQRVIDTFGQLFSGYNSDLKEITSKTYPSGTDKYEIKLEGIEFVSWCEHHFLKISGFVDISYTPSNKIAGFDRFSRLVDHFTRRLQTQERIISELSKTIINWLEPDTLRIIITAEHDCTRIIGAKKSPRIITQINYP